MTLISQHTDIGKIDATKFNIAKLNITNIMTNILCMNKWKVKQSKLLGSQEKSKLQK